MLHKWKIPRLAGGFFYQCSLGWILNFLFFFGLGFLFRAFCLGSGCIRLKPDSQHDTEWAILRLVSPTLKAAHG
ncbi:hypothetical protein AYI72_10645 [Shewanella algae]|nr:hypothetical protein BS332_16520 [Shewanella algae]PWF92270.1 hypothetical protein DD549_09515 [Shewanella algae]TVK95680.1 hypothetical protein AYJ01_02745 [Shewanella algae]TVK98359.1 hypothetical protein AYI83_07545 [Shewanella algae]TVL04556.1 hypothetical protein AYI72_10645 [Shewanella algae]